MICFRGFSGLFLPDFTQSHRESQIRYFLQKLGGVGEVHLFLFQHNLLRPFSNFKSSFRTSGCLSSCRITPTFSHNSNFRYLSSQSLTKLCGYIFEVSCSSFFCFSVPILTFENFIRNSFEHSPRSTVFCTLLRTFSCVSKPPALCFDHFHIFRPMVYDAPSTFNNCFARFLVNCSNIFWFFLTISDLCFPLIFNGCMPPGLFPVRFHNSFIRCCW